MESGPAAGNSAGSGRGKCQSAHRRDRERCPTGQRAQVVDQHVFEDEAHPFLSVCGTHFGDVAHRSSKKDPGDVV